MDPAQGRLVPRQENLFHPGELSYIEGTWVGCMHVFLQGGSSANVWMDGPFPYLP